MEIILTKNLRKRGQAGDQVTVKDGYAVNYLIPQGLAVPATKANLNRLDAIKAAQLKELEARRDEFEALAKAVNGKSLVFDCQTHKGKLYGSITVKDVLKRIQDEFGVAIDKDFIRMPDHIRNLGTLDVEFSFHPEISATLSVDVRSSSEIEEPVDYSETEEAIAEAEEQEELDAAKAAAKAAAAEEAEAVIDASETEANADVADETNADDAVVEDAADSNVLSSEDSDEVKGESEEA